MINMENREIEFRINQLLLNILLSEDMNNIRIEKIKDVFNIYKTKALTDEIEELKSELKDCTENYNHYVDKCFKLESHISELEKENKKLEFMIEHGLGFEDLKNDIDKYPH